MLALLAEGLDDTLRATRNLTAEVPATERGVVLAVVLPHLVNDEAVVLGLLRHIARVPIVARVVEAEVELHAVFVGKAEEHIQQVGRGGVAPLADEVFRRIGDKFAVARANHDNRVDANRAHMLKVGIPLLFAPILVRNIVADFVEKGSGNFHRCSFVRFPIVVVACEGVGDCHHQEGEEDSAQKSAPRGERGELLNPHREGGEGCQRGDEVARGGVGKHRVGTRGLQQAESNPEAQLQCQCSNQYEGG